MAKLIILGFAILLLVIIYGLWDPAQFAFFPRCPFKMLTGLSCPGCGSQRALHQLLHLNILQAIRSNILLVILIPVCFFAFFAALFKDKFPRLYKAFHNHIFSLSICALILIWWVVRNILGV